MKYVSNHAARLPTIDYLYLTRAIITAPKSSNPDYILRSLYWLTEYKISSTKLLQFSSPRYLRNLNTVKPSWSTRSSTLVTLIQPPVDSSLKILLVLLLQLPSPPIMWMYSNLNSIGPIYCMYVCALLIQPVIGCHNPINYHYKLIIIIIIKNTNCSFALLHLTCGTSFLLLFALFVSLVHHHHSALLHRQALILDQLLTFLMAFSTLIIKPFFSQSLSLHSNLSLAQAVIWPLGV